MAQDKQNPQANPARINALVFTMIMESLSMIQYIFSIREILKQNLVIGVFAEMDFSNTTNEYLADSTDLVAALMSRLDIDEQAQELFFAGKSQEAVFLIAETLGGLESKGDFVKGFLMAVSESLTIPDEDLPQFE